jgi:2-iminobutanoate/2-iminopropanoate deaminase
VTTLAAATRGLASELSRVGASVRSPAAPLTPAISWNDVVFVSGQVPRDPSGNIGGTTITEQTREVISNLECVLEAAGTSLEQVVRTTVFLTSIGDLEAVNEVYREFVQKLLPTRTTVEVSALTNPAYLVEIDAIAIR